MTDHPSRGQVFENGLTPQVDNSHLDARDCDLLTEAWTNYEHDLPDHPVVGEWVRFADGTMRRISHVWQWEEGPESIQTSDGGSYHLSQGGGVSMSGSLHPGVKPHTFRPTEEKRPAWFWIWHHGRMAAHQGIDVRIPVRVWANTEPAN